MGRDCNLELCLVPEGIEANVPSPDSANSRKEESEEKLTIFYKGQVCVCNVTEYQAGAILRLADREMDKRTENSQSQPPHSRSSEPRLPAAPRSSETQAPAALMVKRSLQRFLQKRMSRIHSSPYSH